MLIPTHDELLESAIKKTGAKEIFTSARDAAEAVSDSLHRFSAALPRAEFFWVRAAGSVFQGIEVGVGGGFAALAEADSIQGS